MTRLFVRLGALSAAMAVAAGAFGAHALRARLEPRLLEVFETGARYQMYHAIGMLAVAWLLSRVDVRGRAAARASGWLFVAGTVLFSGSLYAMALTGVRALGAITPVGGLCFLAGWAAMVLAASGLAERSEGGA